MSSKKTPWHMEAGNEWVSRDPFGAVKPADVSKRSFPVAGDDGVTLTAARNGYASFRLWVIGSGEYRLSMEMDGGLEGDLFRAWYHRMAKGGPGDGAKYFADALTRVEAGAAQRIPDPDNAVEGQTQQEYWVDVFVPADAAVGPASGKIVLTANGDRAELPIKVKVLEAVIPDEDVVVTDHNSYGCRWIDRMYPDALAGCGDEHSRWVRIIEILQDYYRICHEHRGLFSNLGVGHHGGFDPIYGPAARGSGRDRRLEEWELFDRHYGPVLDGSAFATASPGAPRPRRPARPAWGVYTPINPDWPADCLWWGQPGYEVEFTRGVGQFDEHFRQKGWVTTRPYFFFNHKKRYRWFEWDGDEPKYAKDDAYWLEMGRLYNAVLRDSPVPWLFRMDASWQVKHHFEALAGMVDFWVCGGFSQWYPDEVRSVAARGDVVWAYSGTPGVNDTSAALLEHVWRMWARGMSGHCEWLTVAPGPDPWFACDGAQTGMIYPGERFGIPGPIPSARLKLQRNAVQDIDLIDARARAAGRLDEVREAMGRTVPVVLWQSPPPIARQRPPEEWDSINLSATQDDNMAKHAALDPLWWVDIRRAALDEEVS